MDQQHNNHAFQAGFSKAKDEFEEGYKAAVNQHHGSTVKSDALGQQNVGGTTNAQGGVQQQGYDQQNLGGTGMPQGGAQQNYGVAEQNVGGGGVQQQGYDQQNLGGTGMPQGGAQQNYGGAEQNVGGAGIPQGNAQAQAYDQQNQGGTGIPQGGAQQSAYEQQNYGGADVPQGNVQQQAYDQHKSNLDQDPSAGGAYGGVQQQAYQVHKQNLDQDTGGNQATGPVSGGPTAGVTGGNLNSQLDEEAALHSGPPHGLGNKIKSKLPHHYNDGAKIPRELREEGSGQSGPGPM